VTAVFVAILLGSGVGYALAVGAFAVGFRRVVRVGVRREPDAGLPFVSVVVPARDEADAILPCLGSIFAGTYPPDRYEVIVVDDLSRDATPALVRHEMKRINRVAVAAGGAGDGEAGAEQRLRLLRVPENEDRARAHKKRAIEQGIAAARGTIICTTDADCTVPPDWLREIVARFDGETALVSGPVLYPTGGPAADVEALEFLGLVAVGAGAIGVGRPNLCNGANVAYRKDVFDALGGFSGIDHLTSGDDELLMQKVAYTTEWRVRFCAAPGAAVLTRAPEGLRAFFEQRRRWASKGAHYPHPALVALVAAVYTFYVALLGGLLALPFVPALGLPVAAALGLKVLPEAALLGPACRHFGRLRLMAYFLPAQLLHLPYIVGMGAAGALGGYEWKGRRIAR
jgi:cellulose synthase/poly-beta-1,6-N-acetylglucosamine synthase-like glycosyltransferase